MTTARVVLIAFVLLPGSVFSETIFLRSGQYVTGEVSGQTATTITLRTATGARVIQKAKIRRILYTTTSQEDKQRLEEKARADQERRRKDQLERERVRKVQQEQEAQAKAKAKAEADRKREADEAARKKQAKAGFFDGKLRGSLLHSAILPGWGQRDQGRNRAGNIYSGVALGSAMLTLYFYRDYKPKRKDYESKSDLLLGVAVGAPDSAVAAAGAYGYSQTEAARASMHTAGSRANFFFTVFALNWAWNLVDLVIFRPSSGATVFLDPSNGLNLGFRIQF